VVFQVDTLCVGMGSEKLVRRADSEDTVSLDGDGARVQHTAVRVDSDDSAADKYGWSHAQV
jgi:hypothetical protein